MHTNKSIPEPWLFFLRELDSAVREEVRLDCMGGFVISMVYGFSRPTADLDVLEIAPGEAGRPILELGMKGGPFHKTFGTAPAEKKVGCLPYCRLHKLTPRNRPAGSTSSWC